MGNTTGVKSKIYKYIENIHHKVAVQKYNVTVEGFLEECVNKVSKFFNLPDEEAILFSYMYVEFFISSAGGFPMTPIALDHFAKEDNIPVLKLLTLKENVWNLQLKGYIQLESDYNKSFLTKEYIIPDVIGLAVEKEDQSLLQNVKPLNLKDSKINESSFIYPNKIKEKQLFYPEDIKEDIDNLTQYFGEEKFAQIQKRLDEKGLTPGVCVMLQGASGTGKTETVYQIARKTNRAILHIDLGNVISKWVGETENNISQVFEYYRYQYNLAIKTGKNVPILLFNEADAVFGKRVSDSETLQSTQIHENHIQSILLDNIERQKGIFIATTNVIEQFDSAYDRRFLFKIRFNKPNNEVAKLIWKDKFNWLSEEDIDKISSKYLMTGGQIDNILRKAIMHEILSGTPSSVEEIMDYCKKEKFQTEEKPSIGFGLEGY